MPINLDIALLSSIMLATIGGVWRAYVYYETRKSTLDKENFAFLYRYFTDLTLYRNIQSTPLLKNLFFKQIPLFANLESAAIAVIIRTQYDLLNYNALLHRLPLLLHVKLLAVDKEQARFVATAKAYGFLYTRFAKRLIIGIAVLYAMAILGLAITSYQQGALTAFRVGGVMVALVVPELVLLNYLRRVDYLHAFWQHTARSSDNELDADLF